MIVPETVTCFVWMDWVQDRSSSLSTAELLRWHRYRRPMDRDRFSTGTQLQKRALRELCGTDVALERRCEGCGGGDHGPVAPGDGFASQWSMSLSHSGSLALVAIAPASTSVGIDVEVTNGRHDELARTAFSPAERLSDEQHSHPTVGIARTQRWCRKESVVKATRLGLTVPLDTLEVSGAAEPPRVVNWPGRPPGVEIADIRLFDLGAPQLPAGYRASLAVISTAPVAVSHVTDRNPSGEIRA